MEKQGTVPAPGVNRFERRLHCSVLEAWAWLTESEKRGQGLATGEMELVEGGKVNLHFRHNDLSPIPGAPPDKYKNMADGHSFTGYFPPTKTHRQVFSAAGTHTSKSSFTASTGEHRPTSGPGTRNWNGSMERSFPDQRAQKTHRCATKNP